MEYFCIEIERIDYTMTKVNINHLLENSFWAQGEITSQPKLNQFARMSRVSLCLNVTDSDQNMTGTVVMEAWKKNEEIESFFVLKPGAKVRVEGFIKPEVYQDNAGIEQVRITYIVTQFSSIK